MAAPIRKCIVIGGGIAGASITRALARAGVQVTLLEKANQLCSGATWHAAGLVTRFGSSPKMKKLHVASLRLLTEMHDAHDIGLHLTGSIRIIEKGSRERYLEVRRPAGFCSLLIFLFLSFYSPAAARRLEPRSSMSSGKI